MKNITNDLILKKYVRSEVCGKYLQNYSERDFLVFEYAPGDQVIRQDEPSKFLHLMMEGRCSLRIFLPEGKSVILETLKAPCFIGEMEILSDVSSYCVEALERCYMLSLPLSIYKDRLLNDPEFLRTAANTIIRKERAEALSLIRASAFPLEKRLAHFILDNRKGDLFKVKRVLIAESLGVTPRHVGNVLASFLEKGYLTKEKLTYRIIDEAALRELASPVFEVG